MRQPAHGTVVAYVSLFIALGGSSYAAVKLTGKDIKDGTITNKDVKNRSLLARDFRAGQLPAGPKGDQGPRGLEGPAGIQGLQGIKGDQGLKGDQGIQGDQGEQGTPGTTGAQGPTGALGPTGPAGIAKGYAFVPSNGVLGVGRSKGVISVTKASAGVYCFDLDFTPILGVASAFTNNNATATTAIDADNAVIEATCGTAPHDAIVVTRGANDPASTPVDVSFSVIFE